MITLYGLTVAAVAALTACVLALAAWLLWDSGQVHSLARRRPSGDHAGRHQHGSSSNVPGHPDDPDEPPAAGPPWPPAAAPSFPAEGAAGAAPSPGTPPSGPGQRHPGAVIGQGALGELVIVGWGPSARITSPRVSLRVTGSLPAIGDAPVAAVRPYAEQWWRKWDEAVNEQ